MGGDVRFQPTRLQKIAKYSDWNSPASQNNALASRPMTVRWKVKPGEIHAVPRGETGPTVDLMKIIWRGAARRRQLVEQRAGAGEELPGAAAQASSAGLRRFSIPKR
jgi:hypothetical protein